MTATNHALTGAVIGLVVVDPLIAGALAVVSHFVLDSLPHSGLKTTTTFRDRSFKRLLSLDILLCLVLASGLVLFRPQHWPVALICAFLAASPDLMWLPRYLRAQRRLPERPLKNAIAKFHSRIQWFQKPLGFIFETAWAAAAVSILVSVR